MSEPVCGAEGGTIGIPPHSQTIHCQLPANHATKHWGRSPSWVETWGSSRLPDPTWLVNR